MKNRMQDLDFEQTVAFDSVKDFEFTRKAAQRFRQVVSLDGFEDEDADVIFHYLYKEMELVSFGDHLKRYIYERAGLEEPYNEVTQDVYRDIVIESFHETCTPKSMNPTSTKLTSLVNNWLTQASVKRETVFLLGFGLRMSADDVSDFLTIIKQDRTKKKELENQLAEVEKRAKQNALIREKTKAEEAFEQEKGVLDKALAMEILSKEEYEQKLNIARKKVENFEEIKKIEQQFEMGIITKEEKDEKINALLNT